ncbi:hypothetical protein MPSEU_000920600 [Mayamaea pseudoterrestris]|nr:hypothetical protein MPSEU_000920600 [Mayamaea pseudoterrestris]
MGRKKRSANPTDNANEPAPKKNAPLADLTTGENYPVKKYRPERVYSAMEAFVRYTKAHRMMDATYVRWKIGTTPEKPFCFSTRVGGIDLAWGRGKTREAAMDAACRAAFSLVNAHGYKNFSLDEDCMLEQPVDFPPPPPPPPLMGMPGLPPGLPPMAAPPGYYGAPPPPPPMGLHLPPPPLPHMDGAYPAPPPPPNMLPPPPPAPHDHLIPQPQLLTQAPVASSLGGSASFAATSLHGGGDSTGGNHPIQMSLQTPKASQPKSRALKNGLTLIYDPFAGEDDNGDDDEHAPDSSKELSMEERRALLPKYQAALTAALTPLKQSAESL